MCAVSTVSVYHPLWQEEPKSDSSVFEIQLIFKLTGFFSGRFACEIYRILGDYLDFTKADESDSSLANATLNMN